MAESICNRNVEDSLRCTVCYKISRVQLPIQHCESGHIICQTCKIRVKSCPSSCSKSSASSSSSPEDNQMVGHKCKFSALGCEVIMNLDDDDIVLHEKNCPERIITCPHNECNTMFWSILSIRLYICCPLIGRSADWPMRGQQIETYRQTTLPQICLPQICL